jgi:hypothetical protein
MGAATIPYIIEALHHPNRKHHATSFASASILFLFALSAGAQTAAQQAPQASAAPAPKELRAPDVVFVPTPQEVVQL